MVDLLAAVIVAAAGVWAATTVAAAIRSPGRTQADADSQRVAELLALFAPGLAEAAEDPKALLIWQPLGTAARQLFPPEFAALDRAFGRPFPFTIEQLHSAHARWTSDWLGWERAHDAECKLKAAAAQDELSDRLGSPYARARLEAIEREKLDRYQIRYEEYTRISKGLQALIAAGTPS